MLLLFSFAKSTNLFKYSQISSESYINLPINMHQYHNDNEIRTAFFELENNINEI